MDAPLNICASNCVPLVLMPPLVKMRPDDAPVTCTTASSANVNGRLVFCVARYQPLSAEPAALKVIEPLNQASCNPLDHFR